MNKDTEKKLDELLARMPQRDYDLDAWLSEDETAEFDRLQRTDRDYNLQRTDTDEHGREYGIRRSLWRWMVAAACILIIISVGMTMKLMQQEIGSKPMTTENNARALPSLAQPLPSHQGEGIGVGSETSKTLSLEEEIQTPPLTPPLDGRGVAAPNKEVLTLKRKMAVSRKKVAQASQRDAIADTLGSGIWERKENVVLAVQMLSDCEKTIRREEQEVRNAVIEATFNAVPRPANVILVSDENGAYEVVETKRIINI